MATTTSKKVVPSTKKTLVTGDAVNPLLLNAFEEIIGSSLSEEVTVWLTGVDLMARNIVTVRGMQVTLEKVISDKGNLPTLTTSSVQYWAKAYELRQLKGGEKKTLKALFQLAREASAFVNASNKNKPKAEAQTFASVIEGKSVDAVRAVVPTQGEVAKRKPSTDKNTKYTQKDVPLDALIKAVTKRLKSGKGKENKYDMNSLLALSDVISEIVLKAEGEVAA